MHCFNNIPEKHVWKYYIPLLWNTRLKLSVQPQSGRYTGEENGNPLQYSCLKNSIDVGNWQVTVHLIPYDWATNTIWSRWQAWFQNAGLWAGLISPCNLCPRALDIILTLEPRKNYASQMSIKIFSDPWNLCFSLNNIITLDVGDLLWQRRPC